MESMIGFVTSWYFWVGVFIVITLKSGIKFVPQNRGYVIYTFGKYTKTLGSGINFIIPYVQYIAADRNLKEQTLPIPSQSATTKDNITLDINAVLYIKVTDAAKATNNVNDYKLAVTELAQTTMRNAIGSMELDDCFQQRENINAAIIKAMDDATNPWGVKVIRYEIKDIITPPSIKDDMERQMSAEREKRSAILKAQGARQSEVERAEGEKQARILEAEAAKQEQVLAAQADREAQIQRAEGESQAIRMVAEAKAFSIETVGEQASSKSGQHAVKFELAQDAIKAHMAIAKEGTIVLSDGQTGNNISNTVAQAVAISDSMRTGQTKA